MLQYTFLGGGNFLYPRPGPGCEKSPSSSPPLRRRPHRPHPSWRHSPCRCHLQRLLRCLLVVVVVLADNVFGSFKRLSLEHQIFRGFKDRLPGARFLFRHHGRFWGRYPLKAGRRFTGALRLLRGSKLTRSSAVAIERAWPLPHLTALSSSSSSDSVISRQKIAGPSPFPLLWCSPLQRWLRSLRPTWPDMGAFPFKNWPAALRQPFGRVARS
jgi:hypothetical protein